MRNFTPPLALALLAGPLVAGASEPERCRLWHSDAVTSQSGAATARLEEGESGIVAVVRHADGRTQRVPLSAPPDHLLVSDAGHVVAAGSRCEYLHAQESLAGYRPDGRAAWSHALPELDPDLNPRSSYGSVGYHRVSMVRDARGRERVRLVLRSRHEVRVALDDGAIERHPVSDAELEGDAEAATARGTYLLHRDRLRAEALLRRAAKLHPADPRPAQALADHYLIRSRFDAEALALWRRLAAQLPPSRNTALGLLRCGEPREALEIAEAVVKRESEKVEAGESPHELGYAGLLHGRILLALGDAAAAERAWVEALRHRAATLAGVPDSWANSGNSASQLLYEIEKLEEDARKAGHPGLAARIRAEGTRRVLALSDRDAGNPARAYQRAELLLGAGEERAAVALLESLATEHAEAALRLAGFHLTGEVLDQDFAAARRGYRHALAASDPGSSEQREAWVALCFLERRLAPLSDLGVAAEACAHAAESSSAGRFWYAVHLAAGAGVEPDPARAEALLEEAREHYPTGNERELLDPGLGIHPQLVPDFEWAAAALEPLAASGSVAAQAVLARLHYDGPLGARHGVLARRWWARAAAAGDARAAMRLWMALPEPRCARTDLLEQAAAGGEGHAHFALASCHLRGEVAEPDLAFAEESLARWSATLQHGHQRRNADWLYAELGAPAGPPGRATLGA